MSIKHSIPRLYRANAMSICAWMWIESAMYCQAGDEKITIAEAAKRFQKFFNLEEDDFDIYHIRMCYYRMQEANREREEEPMCFPAEPSGEVIKALAVIKEFLNEKS